MQSQNLKTLGFSLAILALNLIFKGIFLSFNSLGWDEPFSVFHAQLEVGQIAKLLATGNNPPLYEIILHYWTQLFGLSEFAVRFPSLIFSSVTAVLIFLIGKKHFSFPVAVTAALLFSFSNYQVFFAHEARVYTLFGMLATASMFVFINACAKQSFNTKNLVLLVAINALMLYSHYFGFFILFIQTLIVFSFGTIRKNMWNSYLIYGGVLALLYLPFISIVLNRLLESTTGGTWVDAPNGPDELYEMLRRFTNAPVVTVACLLLMVAALVLYLARRKQVTGTTQHKIIIIWFFLPFIFMFVLSYWVPMFIDRYLIYLATPLYLIIAICAQFIFSNKKMATGLQVLIIGLFIVTSKPNLDNKRHVEETITKINELKKPGTEVFFCPQHFIFNYAYYHDISLFQNINTADPYTTINSNLQNNGIHGINNSTAIDTSALHHIIYLDAGADFSSPDNGIYDYLDKNFVLLETHEFPEIFKVFVFGR